jgi:hypothetical protein
MVKDFASSYTKVMSGEGIFQLMNKKVPCFIVSSFIENLFVAFVMGMLASDSVFMVLAYSNTKLCRTSVFVFWIMALH